MRILVALALLSVALPGRAARAAEALAGPRDHDSAGTAPGTPWGSGPEAPELDDARARTRAARALREGEADAQTMIRRLDLARQERGRAAVRPQLRGQLQASSPSALASPWISLGPTRADNDFNIVGYHSIDSGRVRTIVPHPSDPGILYLATAGGGVWKTYDAGASWEPITDALGSLAVGALALDPESPEVLYLGLGDPFDALQPGLVRSLDGGLSFSAPVFPTASYGGVRLPATSVRDLKVDPGNSGHILVATDAGLFSWTGDGQSAPVQLALPDRGGGTATAYQTWSIGWLGPKSWLVSGRQLDLTHADTPPAGTRSIGLWRSTDDGQSWQNVVSGLPQGDVGDLGRATIAVAPSTTLDPATARVYLLAANLDDGASKQKDVYTSDDGGQTFQGHGVNAGATPTNPNSQQPNLDVLAKQAWYNQAILVDPDDSNLVFVGGQLSMVRSSDGGATWSVMSDWLPLADGTGLPYLHADYHAMAVGLSAAGKKVLFVGGDGGLFSSTDAFSAPPGGAHIDDGLNQGLVTHLTFSLACAAESWPANLQEFVIGGLQDNGTRLRSTTNAKGAGTFDQVTGGDGFGVAVSRDVVATGPVAILASAAGELFRSSAGGGGSNWAPFTVGLLGQLPFFVRLEADHNAADGQTFLTFTDPNDSSVYLSSGGKPWQQINGTVHYPDGSSQPTFVDYGKQAVSFHDVHAHQQRSGVYGVTGTNGAVFSTSDGGANWTAAQVLGTNSGRALGIRGASQIAFDPNDPSGMTFLVGSDTGLLFDPASADLLNPPTQPVPDDYGHLFKTTNSGHGWISITGGGAIPRGSNPNTLLPNVPIEAVKFDPGGQTLYVGTWLGLYKSTDGGLNFSRDPGLPLVKVTDICIAPQSSNLKISTYGRGFWQLNPTPGGAQAGARGNGDLDFNQRLDAFDLIDLAAALGTTNQSAGYRQEADLVGSTNTIDDADLTAFLLRFGGAP